MSQRSSNRRKEKDDYEVLKLENMGFRNPALKESITPKFQGAFHIAGHAVRSLQY
jgi:hypothetical protein